jgi:hypothetical protein
MTGPLCLVGGAAMGWLALTGGGLGVRAATTFSRSDRGDDAGNGRRGPLICGPEPPAEGRRESLIGLGEAAFQRSTSILPRRWAADVLGFVRCVGGSVVSKYL